MVGRKETDRHIGNPDALRIFRQRPGIKLAQRLGDIVVEYLRIVLLDHALQGRNRRIIHPVSRGIPFHVPVGHPQRQIGVRIEIPVTAHHHLAPHIIPLRQLDLRTEPVDFREQVTDVPLLERLVKQVRRILAQSGKILLFQLRNALRIRKDRLGEKGVRPSRDRAVLSHLLLEVNWLKRLRDTLFKFANQSNEHLLFQSHVVVLIEAFTMGGYLVGRLSQDPDRRRRKAGKSQLGCHLRIIISGKIIRLPQPQQGIDPIHHTLVVRPGSPLPETLLIRLLGRDRIHPADAQALPLPLLPGVGYRGRPGTVSDPHLLTPSHVRLDDAKP